MHAKHIRYNQCNTITVNCPLCIVYADVYSTYDHTDISIIHASEPSPHPISISCYAEHVCQHHLAHVVWLLAVSGGPEQQYLAAADSDLLLSEFGISVTSTCTEVDCRSTLVLPCHEELNATRVRCGAYVDVCPGEVTSRSSAVTVVTREYRPPPPQLTPEPTRSTPAPQSLPSASRYYVLTFILSLLLLLLLLLACVALQRCLPTAVWYSIRRHLNAAWLIAKRRVLYLATMVVTALRSCRDFLATFYYNILQALVRVRTRPQKPDGISCRQSHNLRM